MYHHRPGPEWDEKERKMDEADIKAGDEPDKEKVDVVTEEEQKHEHDIPISGIFCVYCEDIAVHIFDGNSLCRECFNKEKADIIKEWKKKSGTN